MGQKEKGIYEKFRVERTDGTSTPGQKHDGCFYFVLDINHDPHAVPALKAYADAAQADGYDLLAIDIRSMLSRRKILEVERKGFDEYLSMIGESNEQ